MIILLRHGQTEVNRGGRFQGRLDAPLTDLGRRQAEAAAAAVHASADPVRVVTSPLRRASATAAALGLEVEVDERWIELDYGEWDGRALDSVPPEVWASWRADPSFAPPAGESLLALSERVTAACRELAAEAAERDVVVVSHVSPMKAAVAWALGVGPETSWRSHLGVAAICRVAVAGSVPTLHSFNETAHLQGVASSP